MLIATSMRARKLIASVVLTGCYNTYVVAPTELPKLSGAYSQTQNAYGYSAYGGSMAVTTVNESVRHLARPDGTMVEISGAPDVALTTQRAGVLTFAHPVQFAITPDGILDARGSNRANQIPLGDIARAEVSVYDRNQTMLATYGIIIGVSLVLLGAVAASEQ